MKHLLLSVALLLTVFPSIVSADTLTVATIERPPFASQTTDGQWRGFSIALVEEIAARSGHDLQYQTYDAFAGMLSAVEANQVSLAAANISATAEREAVMDFTQPIFDSGLQIIVPADSAGKGLFQVVWESGILTFLLGAIAALLVMAHLVWLFERNIDNPRHDYFRDDYLGGIWDAFWWAFIIVTMGGFENERPHHYVGRALAVFWVTTSLFFVSALTAQITTALTVAELSSDIQSVRDLHGKRVGAPVGTTIATFLDENQVAYTPYDDFTDVLAAVSDGELDAAVGDAPVVQQYAATVGNGHVRVVGDVFAPDSIALAFPEDSPYLETFNQTLLAMKHDGSYERLRVQYFGE